MPTELEQWTAAATAYNEYIKALGDYKLNSANAEKALAEAAQKWAEVRAWTVVINRLERDLRALTRAQNALRREVQKVKRKAQYTQYLLRGRRIDGTLFYKGWQGYTYFEAKVLLGPIGESLYEIVVPANARTAVNFVLCSRRQAAVEDAPGTIENVLQLIHFLHEKRYISKAGSRAQRVVRRLLAAINSVADERVAEIERRMTEIRDETYNAWDFAPLIGQTENSAAKRIEEAGPMPDS